MGGRNFRFRHKFSRKRSIRPGIMRKILSRQAKNEPQLRPNRKSLPRNAHEEIEELRVQAHEHVVHHEAPPNDNARSAALKLRAGSRVRNASPCPPAVLARRLLLAERHPRRLADRRLHRHGGVGDARFELFWDARTLTFNPKTIAYRQRFFDTHMNATRWTRRSSDSSQRARFPGRRNAAPLGIPYGLHTEQAP